jgi:hypothetical protein
MDALAGKGATATPHKAKNVRPKTMAGNLKLNVLNVIISPLSTSFYILFEFSPTRYRLL